MRLSTQLLITVTATMVVTKPLFFVNGEEPLIDLLSFIPQGDEINEQEDDTTTTTVPTSPPPDDSDQDEDDSDSAALTQCTTPRKVITSSYIECLSFPSRDKKLIKKCEKQHSQNWKELEELMEGTADDLDGVVCTDGTPFALYEELVDFCYLAELNGEECKVLVNTLVDLSSRVDNDTQEDDQEEKEEKSKSTKSTKSGHTNNEDEEEEQTITCDVNDIVICPDGFTIVAQDPNNNCEYAPCPPVPVYCTSDAMECPGNSNIWVGRDPDNNCEFYPCPPDNEVEEKQIEVVVICPCSSYIQSVTIDNVDAQYSCKITRDAEDCTNLSRIGIWQNSVQAEGYMVEHALGAEARIDGQFYSCQAADMVNDITMEQAQACIQEIVDRCTTVGLSVCSNDDN